MRLECPYCLSLSCFCDTPVTPLILAIYNGTINDVKQAIFDGVDVNVRDTKGSTPLHIAYALGKFHLLEILVNVGADVNINTIGGVPLLPFAACDGNDEIVSLFINADADVNARGTLGDTPLLSAVAGGHEKCVQVLINAGANLNTCTQDVVKSTPLHLAAMNGDVAIYNLLKESGANENAVDKLGLTPRYILSNK